jgi:NitT/TauT family transport system substrate-binding protein
MSDRSPESFASSDNHGISTGPHLRDGWRALTVAALAAAALLVTAFGDPARAQNLRDITVTQSTADSVAFLPIYIAKYNHYFEDEGFRVNLIITNGGGPDVAALISGQAQFTAAGPINQLALFQQGQRTLSVASFFDRLIGNIVIRKDIYDAKKLGSLPVEERIKALKGLKISVTRLGSLTDMVARSYLRRAGLDPQKDAMIVATTAGAPQIAALMQKQVDAVSATTPASEEMVSRGAGVMLVNNTHGEDPFFVPFAEQTILVMPAWAQQNPDLVKAFVRAIVKAETWAHAHSSEDAAKIMVSYVPSLDVKVLADQIELIKDGIPTTGCISQKGIEANFKLFDAAGLLTKPMQWTDIATNEYLPSKCTP